MGPRETIEYDLHLAYVNGFEAGTEEQRKFTLYLMDDAARIVDRALCDVRGDNKAIRDAMLKTAKTAIKMLTDFPVVT